jgi:hypothetical protein
VILFVCPNDPMISPFALCSTQRSRLHRRALRALSRPGHPHRGPSPDSAAFALEGPDMPIMMLPPNTTVANDSRLLLQIGRWCTNRAMGPEQVAATKPALILERDDRFGRTCGTFKPAIYSGRRQICVGGHRRDLRPVPRRRGHRDCGSLTDRLVIRGADGGGITGPISPSGAVSRSTITGA